jgi:hypothetical protein
MTIDLSSRGRRTATTTGATITITGLALHWLTHHA